LPDCTGSRRTCSRGINCRFNVSELLRGDIKARYEAYQVGIQSGFLTPADARAAEGLPPVVGSDQLMFPMNYGSLANVANPPAPAATPAVPNPVGGLTGDGG
jgi:hypothetical protein